MRLSVLAFVTTTAFIAGSTSSAQTNTGWERPVARAVMNIERAMGFFGHVRSAELIESQMTNSSERRFQLLLDHEPIALRVVSLVQDACGAIRIVARNDAHGPTMTRIEMHLIDHRASRCLDIVPILWRAKVRAFQPNRTALVPDEIDLRGQPEPILTMNHR